MDDKFHTVRGYEIKNYNEKTITSAMEDYLEMIYRHLLNEKYIRVNQLSKLLNVSNSSVSKMIQKLTKLGLINYEKYGIITMTKKGKNLGHFLLKRHNIIEEFLIFIGCTDDILIQTELIEHIINKETIEKIEKLLSFFKSNKDIMEQYNEYKKNT